MSSIAQSEAIDRNTLSDRDRVAFWRDPRWDNLECLHATFVNHEYNAHTHDTFVIGVIERGVELYHLNGRSLAAVAGDVCVVNPCELHDGRPGSEGYRYRMFYPSAGLMYGLAEQVTERTVGAVHFSNAIYRDPDAYHLLSSAHRTMEASPDTLSRDEAFLRAAGLLIRRYADTAAPDIAIGREGDAIARVCDYAEDHLDDDLDLSVMADVAGFSRYRLIRTFRREKGITPHAWVTNRRVERAKRLLAFGDAPADVAAACGFYDQAHMTRLFKGVTGVTPAKYRAAFLQ